MHRTRDRTSYKLNLTKLRMVRYNSKSQKENKHE